MLANMYFDLRKVMGVMPCLAHIHEMNMKFFKIISPCNWATGDKECHTMLDYTWSGGYQEGMEWRGSRRKL